MLPCLHPPLTSLPVTMPCHCWNLGPFLSQQQLNSHASPHTPAPSMPLGR
jgi:hypothetical protein